MEFLKSILLEPMQKEEYDKVVIDNETKQLKEYAIEFKKKGSLLTMLYKIYTL